MSDKMNGMSAKPKQGDLVIFRSVVSKNGVSIIVDFLVVGKSGPSGGTPFFHRKKQCYIPSVRRNKELSSIFDTENV